MMSGSSPVKVPSTAAGRGLLPGISFEEYRLDNGLQVLLYRDAKAPIVHVLVWYHVGSKDEPRDRTGFAHLFEHMMFQGSENVAKTEHFTHVQGVGGITNASTSQDRTNYFQTVPSEYLGLGLWLEADRMRSLNVSAENFENQLSVVKEERKQRYDNQPYGLWYLEMLEMLFGGSSYGWGPIGDMAHLDAAPLESVQEFHRTFYVPNNAVLIVSGDFDRDEAKRLIGGLFGDIPRGPEIDRRVFQTAPLKEQVRRTLTAQVPFPAVFIAFRGVPSGHPDEAALNLLASVLGGGQAGRLRQALVHGREIALSAFAFNREQEYAGVFLAQAHGVQGATAEELEEGIWGEIEKIRRDGVTVRELESAFHRVESAMARRLMSLQSIADMLAQYQVFEGDADRVNRLLDQYAAVTVDDLLRVCRTYLAPESGAVLHYLPEA